MKEMVLQNRCRKYLEDDGWIVFKLPPFVTGIPDTLALKNGQAIWMEFKKEKGGKTGFYQARWIQRLTEAGFYARYISTWEEFKEMYNEARTIQISKGGS